MFDKDRCSLYNLGLSSDYHQQLNLRGNKVRNKRHYFEIQEKPKIIDKDSLYKLWEKLTSMYIFKFQKNISLKLYVVEVELAPSFIVNKND